MHRIPLALLAGLISSTPAAAAEDQTGFGYCAPPVAPACVDDRVTYRSPKTLEACKNGVQRYVDSVAAYRSCLGHETERAIVQINATLDRYKCMSAGKKKCPTP